MSWNTSTRRQRLPKNWQTIRNHIMQRDNHLCQLNYHQCTTIATEVDHIVQGDDHHYQNLQAVCKNCHTQKTHADNRKAPKKRPKPQHPGLNHTKP